MQTQSTDGSSSGKGYHAVHSLTTQYIKVFCLGVLSDVSPSPTALARGELRDPAATHLSHALMFLIVAEIEPGSWRRIGLWVVKVEERTWTARSGAGTMELRSVLLDPHRALGHEWEYKTTRACREDLPCNYIHVVGMFV
jgi:hypothetical protein